MKAPNKSLDGNMILYSKSAVHITPVSRVKRFGADVFVVEEGLLICKVCNTHINHVRKQTITDH